MKFVMCVSCGEFVRAVPDGDDVQPTVDACPSCGDTTFKDNETGEIIRTDE